VIELAFIVPSSLTIWISVSINANRSNANDARGAIQEKYPRVIWQMTSGSHDVHSFASHRTRGALLIVARIERRDIPKSMTPATHR
jgi:hypothetical protein